MKTLIITIVGVLFIWWNLNEVFTEPPSIYHLLFALGSGAGLGVYLFNRAFDAVTSPDR